jgi:hypothetical protein
MKMKIIYLSTSYTDGTRDEALGQTSRGDSERGERGSTERKVGGMMTTTNEKLKLKASAMNACSDESQHLLS